MSPTRRVKRARGRAKDKNYLRSIHTQKANNRAVQRSRASQKASWEKREREGSRRALDKERVLPR